MTEDDPLPGFMLREQYMRRVHDKSDFTGRRWQARGELVVEYFGRTPFVNTVATAERKRSGDRPRRGRPRAA